MLSKEIKKLQNKKIAILGLGIENYALIKFLLRQKVECMITICDIKKKAELGDKYQALKGRKNIAWKTNKYARQHLDGFDILFRSPGWPVFDPEIKKAVKMGVELTSPINLFFSFCPTKNIIGITGTKGKGTTASLIFKILQQAGKRAWLGGNIGVAPFDFLKKIRKNDWVVLELSSFQLEDMTVSPHIAVIVNFFKEHLAPADPYNPNYHTSMQDYWRAKLNIAKWQKRGDKVAVSRNLAAKIKSYELKGKAVYFTKSNLKNRLAGEHNKENIAAAVEVASIVGIKDGVIKRVVEKFKGLEHRLEFVRKVNGVAYYDDSFATTPESTMTALKCFTAPIILLAGGAEKSSNFKKLAKRIKKQVKYTVLFKGEATPRFKKVLLRVNIPKSKIKLAGSMKEAVKIARSKAGKGDVALLSPACASFGIFKNYKERGELFKKEVRRIK
jgi:UDP-N-acetylmuramoylalanine--D-glutamate ligase